MSIEQAYHELAPKLQSYLTGNGCSSVTACDIMQDTFLRHWSGWPPPTATTRGLSGTAFRPLRKFPLEILKPRSRRANCHEM